MRMPRRNVLLVVALAGVAAGLAYFISGLVYVPDVTRFEATGELRKTEYSVGESIWIEPFLTYTGSRRVTIYSARPLLFVDVHSAENVRTVTGMVDNVKQFHTLEPNVPYNEKDRWPPATSYSMAYRFSLEQAGRYKVVVRADFGLDEHPSLHVYSEPIWVEVIG